jgi:hypothetical protein
MGFVWAVISGESLKMQFIQIDILHDDYPDRPSSQGSPRSSNRECSAVLLVWHASSPSACMGLPQQAGIFESSASISVLLPQ